MPNDYTKIRCHMIFTVKHDGQHKARFVTGNLIQPAIESVFSGVVSICSDTICTKSNTNQTACWSML